MLKTHQCRDSQMHYSYGVRALEEILFFGDSLGVEMDMIDFDDFGG